MSTGNKPKIHTDVWTILLSEPRELLLSPEEYARAARFHSAKQCLHWRHCHSALRVILARYLDAEPLALRFTTNPNGKPLLDGLHFNLSHTEDYAMIAVSLEGEIGIDIERYRPKIDMALLLERLGETDLPEGDPFALHQRWTRREAASKARGAALFDPPDLSISVVDLKAPDGHFASLASVGGRPVVSYCGL